MSILNNFKIFNSSDVLSLQQSKNFDLVDMSPTTAVFDKKQSTVLNNAPLIGEG